VKERGKVDITEIQKSEGSDTLTSVVNSTRDNDVTPHQMIEKFEVSLCVEEQQDNSSHGDSDASNDRACLNDSITSKGSLREEEILRTKEEVGASSIAFLQELRGAAFRRKADLTRSSSYLAAKEREQREAVASRAKHRTSSARVDCPNVGSSDGQGTKVINKHFHALPLPATTGTKGSGGMAGVPKVHKKPTTIPSSPLLGARRQRLNPKSNEDAIEKNYQEENGSFRALPLPKTTGHKGHAGLSGVPKVAKRPPTVPFSPLLGPRRPKEKSIEIKKDDAFSQNQPSPGQKEMLSQSASSQGLLGLSLVENRSMKSDVQRTPPVSNTASTRSIGYQPHSTIRAQHRASYEAQKYLMEKRRKEELIKTREQQVRNLRKELKDLRKSL